MNQFVFKRIFTGCLLLICVIHVDRKNVYVEYPAQNGQQVCEREAPGTMVSERVKLCLASDNTCLGGRTTVGMMGLWSAVSSSVGSSRI